MCGHERLKNIIYGTNVEVGITKSLHFLKKMRGKLVAGRVASSALQGSYWGVLNGCLLAQVIRIHFEILVSVILGPSLTEGFFHNLFNIR